MAAANKPRIGSIPWADLTVSNAGEVRDFYRRVVGWTSTDVPMSGYSDYCMNEPEGEQTVAGICHARGVNEGLPAQWLLYIVVADVEAAASRCVEAGGAIVRTPTPMGPNGRYCVIRDPGGAVAALYEPAV